MGEKNELIVRKNNTLVKARYSLTTNETKVFLLLLYKLQVAENSELKCTIKKSEFKEIFRSSRDCTEAAISKTLSSLRVSPIHFKIDNEWGEFGFINGFTYDPDEETFVIYSSQKIYDVVKNYLDGGYTPNNLAVLFKVRNTYAFRLYDLLRLWSGNKNIIEYKIDELRELLMLEDKYPLYADFKKRVIKPAVAELNKTGVIKVEDKDNKNGRKVESIKFTVTDLDKRKGFNEDCFKGTNKENKELYVENIDSSSNDNDNKENKSVVEFYIPDELAIDEHLKRKFAIDFKAYDFKNEEYLKAALDAEYIATAKDNVDTINHMNYNLFKSTLKNKISSLELSLNNKLQEDEDNKYWEMLTEEQREEAFNFNMNCKEYYQSFIFFDKTSE